MPTYASRSLWTSAAVGLDPATLAWIANVFAQSGGTVVSDAQALLVNALIVGLKDDGVWDKLDELFLFAVENADEFVNGIVQGTIASATSSPTFAVDVGYTGNGTSSFVNSNFNPTTAPGAKFIQDSASFFAWNNTAGLMSIVSIAGYAGHDFRLQLAPGDNGSGQAIWSINAFATQTPTSTGEFGLYLNNRSGATASTFDVNGVEIDSSTNGSTAPTNANFGALTGAGGSGFSPRQCSALGFGENLSSGERVAIFTHLNTYMTARGAAGGLDADTDAWIAAVVANGGSITWSRVLLVDALITGLKDDGVWTKLDRLWLFASDNEDTALVDLVVNDIATPSGSPTFTPDDGYSGGAPAYIDTNYNPTTDAINYTQDAASAFAWAINSASDDGAIFGSAISAVSGAPYLWPRYTDDNSYYGVNHSGAGDSVASTDGSGFWAVVRSQNNLTTLYRNGSSFDTDTTASTNLPNVNLYGLREAANYYTRICACLGYAGLLSGTDVSNLNTRLRDYMDGVGVP